MYKKEYKPSDLHYFTYKLTIEINMYKGEEELNSFVK